MNKGYVYILGNEAMPDLYKVGMTTDRPEARTNQLYQTGVPARFDILETWISPDCRELEAAAHKSLKNLRYSDEREFFYGPLFEITQMIDDAHKEQIGSWVEEFMPDCIVVRPEEVLELDQITEAAKPFKMNPFEVLDALGSLETHEMLPAVERYKKRRKEKKAARELKLVANS